MTFPIEWAKPSVTRRYSIPKQNGDRSSQSVFVTLVEGGRGVFAVVGKGGSDLNATVDGLARSAGRLLRRGIDPLKYAQRDLRGITTDGYNPFVHTASSVPDAIGRSLEAEHTHREDVAS